MCLMLIAFTQQHGHCAIHLLSAPQAARFKPLHRCLCGMGQLAEWIDYSNLLQILVTPHPVLFCLVSKVGHAF